MVTCLGAGAIEAIATVLGLRERSSAHRPPSRMSSIRPATGSTIRPGRPGPKHCARRVVQFFAFGGSNAVLPCAPPLISRIARKTVMSPRPETVDAPFAGSRRTDRPALNLDYENSEADVLFVFATAWA